MYIHINYRHDIFGFTCIHIWCSTRITKYITQSFINGLLQPQLNISTKLEGQDALTFLLSLRWHLPGAQLTICRGEAKQVSCDEGPCKKEE